MRWRALATVALAVAGAACDRDEQSQSPATQVLVAMVRDAATQAPPRRDPEELPVVYVVSTADEGVAPKVQAAVASTLNEEIDVRFADVRREAVDDERSGLPVHDEGIMLQVAEVDPDGDPVDMEVELYRSETQFSVRTMTFAESSDTWSVTSTSVLEEQDVPPTSGAPSVDEPVGSPPSGP